MANTHKRVNLGESFLKIGKDETKVKKILWLLLFGSIFICYWTNVVSAARILNPYTIPEIKWFTLQERTVVAVAIDDQKTGYNVENVLGYQLIPTFDEKRTADRLEVTITNVVPAWRDLPAGLPLTVEHLGAGKIKLSLQSSAATQIKLSTVRRKTVKTDNGIIRMRTYLVFSIPRGDKKEVPTIVIDPGHGGEDTGAVKNFIMEKDLNLDIGLRAARLFTSKGWNVLLTRSTDVEPSLLERADMANIVDATVFISVHNNSLPEEKLSRSREFGTTVLYNSSAVNPAYDLARITQDELVGSLGTQREILQDRPRLVVLNSTWVPAILTEGIMMPNPANAKMILDRIQRQRTAEALLRAVETWRGRKVLASKKPHPTSFVQPIQMEASSVNAGNYAGNTVNRGVVAEKNGWIYYLRKADSLSGETEETIWRFRTDRFLSDELVTDQEVWDLNIAEDKLYYSNWSDGHSIYQANLDGSKAARLLDGPAEQLSIAGNRLVFVRNRQIFSIPKTGGMPFLITEDIAENTVVFGDWVYYANGSDRFKPYRVKLDGTGHTKIADDETLFLGVAGDWLFYSNLSDGEKLYRVRTDGTQRSKISEDRSGYLNFDRRFIYYTNTSQGNALFSIKPDGSERKKIMEGEVTAGPIGIVGGKGYYRGIFFEIK